MQVERPQRDVLNKFHFANMNRDLQNESLSNLEQRIFLSSGNRFFVLHFREGFFHIPMQLD